VSEKPLWYTDINALDQLAQASERTEIDWDMLVELLGEDVAVSHLTGSFLSLLTFLNDLQLEEIGNTKNSKTYQLGHGYRIRLY